MKLKKGIVVGLAVVVLTGSVLNVSAAGTTSYVKTLKKINNADLIIDVEAYKAAYSDLEAAFGDDTDAYIEHYLTIGVYEGRTKGVLFDPLAYAESYSDIKEAFGDDIPAIVNHYVTYGIEENRTKGTADGYEDIAAAEKAGVQWATVPRSSTGSSAKKAAGNSGSNTSYRHTTSIYASDESTLLRVEYYDDNNHLYEYSSVSNFDSSTKSYTEYVYVFDDVNKVSVLKRTDTYVNGVLVSSVQN